MFGGRFSGDFAEDFLAEARDDGSVLGLLLGRKVASKLGDYGEMMGGLILFAFGLKALF